MNSSAGPSSHSRPISHEATGVAAALAVETNAQPSALSVRDVQMRLIDDPQAPSAIVPLWDTPWHHTHWRQRQIQALESRPLEPAAPQTCPVGAAAQQGWIHRDDHGGFQFEQAGQEAIPLITLEPAVHERLQRIDTSTSITLHGVRNHWGPWIRVTTLH